MITVDQQAGKATNARRGSQRRIADVDVTINGHHDLVVWVKPAQELEDAPVSLVQKASAHLMRVRLYAIEIVLVGGHREALASNPRALLQNLNLVKAAFFEEVGEVDSCLRRSGA